MPASLYKPPSRRYGGGCSRRTQRPTACAEQAPSQASKQFVGAIRTALQDFVSRAHRRLPVSQPLTRFSPGDSGSVPRRENLSSKT
jgi:hypothetical protein